MAVVKAAGDYFPLHQDMLWRSKIGQHRLGVGPTEPVGVPASPAGLAGDGKKMKRLAVLS
jgi:hypothetical protein